MNKLEELAERLERASGPDRELDAQIGRYAAAEFLGHVPDAPQYGCQPFTASIDAAMSLVPEGWAYKIGRNWCELWPMSPEVSDEDWPDDWDDDRQHFGKTPALALAAASLRARSHK